MSVKLLSKSFGANSAGHRHAEVNAEGQSSFADEPLFCVTAHVHHLDPNYLSHVRCTDMLCEAGVAFVMVARLTYSRSHDRYQHSVQSLLAAESRQRELQSREEESSEQQQRLLQRQRHFGGEEIRLSGIEGALQRQSSLLGGTASSLTESIEDMRRKLARLRGSESDWAERERLQQLEVQLLEAQLLREPRADLEAACVLMS
ncbi:unnamed protein product [Polarella glacialis]|uniref:Uncharacterized protein n=1 Tax=Polarella glacialis TaxID=89957 RepID=A0A813LWD2_POLGL|nr:unnamed protein product [Polarella glacialis]